MKQIKTIITIIINFTKISIFTDYLDADYSANLYGFLLYANDSHYSILAVATITTVISFFSSKMLYYYRFFFSYSFNHYFFSSKWKFYL